MNRYQTIGPLTTATVAADESLQIDIDAALAGFALPASFNIVKVKIQPEISSAYEARIYTGASYSEGQRLIRWEGHSGAIYYPIDRTDNGYAEGKEGWPIPYDETAGLEVLHLEIKNNDLTYGHVYTYTFTIEEVPVFSAAGNVAFRGNLSQPASAYHNWGATLGAAGYGIRDNAGSIQFKNSGGAWATIGAAGSGVTSVIGTANQVVVSSATGDVTFSLPQSIATTSTPTFASLTLTAPLTVPNGGTGVATLAANGVLYGNAAGVVLAAAQGPANSVLTANAGAPSFSATPTLTSLTLTGVLATGVGSVSVPVHSSTTYTSTGAYFTAGPTYNIAVNGALSTVFNATGVGIGVTPTARLSVSYATIDPTNGIANFYNPNMTEGQSNFVLFGKAAVTAQSAAFGYYYSATTNNAGSFFVNYGDAFATEGLFVRKGGKVGIGTITPTSKLEIVGGTIRTYVTVAAYLRLDRSTTTLDNAITWVDAGNDKWYLGALPTGGAATAFHLYSVDKTGGAGDVLTVLAGGTITLAGNVGIGTATFGTSAAKVLGIFNGVEPSTSPADTLQIYCVDLSAGNATLGIRTETAVAVDAALISTHSLQIRLNGATRKLMLA